MLRQRARLVLSLPLLIVVLAITTTITLSFLFAVCGLRFAVCCLLFAVGCLGWQRSIPVLAMSYAYPTSPGPRAAATPQLSLKLRKALPSSLHYLVTRILAAASRLETSTSPSLNIARVRQYRPTNGEKLKYGILISVALFALYVMEEPTFPLKLFIPALFTLVLLIPLTTQFFLPASPIFGWLILFYSCRFIPAATRPHIWVSVLPTLETIWYGANISDILTRFGHPALDIIAWIPYGVIHFIAPFVVAACLFVFAPPGSVKVFGAAFGFMNLIGVVIQIMVPCAPPCEYPERMRRGGLGEEEAGAGREHCSRERRAHINADWW